MLSVLKEFGVDNEPTGGRKKSLDFTFGGGSGFIGQPELFSPASI